MREVTQALETYDVTGATRPIQTFVDHLSNWYLRRSAAPFLEDPRSDADKQAAYATLYEALVTLSKLLAPTMPFLAEELYQNLVRSAGLLAPESVHLATGLTVDPGWLDEKLNREMRAGDEPGFAWGTPPATRRRSKCASRWPRWPFRSARPEERLVLETYADLLMDELNVKQRARPRLGRRGGLLQPETAAQAARSEI